jgi:hypothetical protein
VRFTIKVKKFETEWIEPREAAGYPQTKKFNDLRHGAASEIINTGVDLFTVGGVLGHKCGAGVLALPVRSAALRAFGRPSGQW